jgi:hypothetical protein
MRSPKPWCREKRADAGKLQGVFRAFVCSVLFLFALIFALGQATLPTPAKAAQACVQREKQYGRLVAGTCALSQVVYATSVHLHESTTIHG